MAAPLASRTMVVPFAPCLAGRVAAGATGYLVTGPRRRAT